MTEIQMNGDEMHKKHNMTHLSYLYKEDRLLIDAVNMQFIWLVQHVQEMDFEDKRNHFYLITLEASNSNKNNMQDTVDWDDPLGRPFSTIHRLVQ